MRSGSCARWRRCGRVDVIDWLYILNFSCFFANFFDFAICSTATAEFLQYLFYLFSHHFGIIILIPLLFASSLQPPDYRGSFHFSASHSHFSSYFSTSFGSCIGHFFISSIPSCIPAISSQSPPSTSSSSSSTSFLFPLDFYSSYNGDIIAPVCLPFFAVFMLALNSNAFKEVLTWMGRPGWGDL